MQNVIQGAVLKYLASPLVAFLFFVPTLAAQSTDDSEIVRAAENAVILPEPIPDPIEPVNRFLWEVNKGLMIGVIKPTGKVYRWVVRRPIREGIRNIGRNLGYPPRLVNNLLQRRWIGARDETYRFLGNSTFGLAGFFDLATTDWEIPESPADFGQTLGGWGWNPHFYLMLPLAGPSNERDAFGTFVDGLLQPISYFPPYSYIPPATRYNNLTESVDEYVRASKADFDPYYVLRYAWTIKREARDVPLTFEGEQDAASLDTLQSVFFGVSDPRFLERGENHSVTMLTTGKELPFTYWLRETSAPVVYLVPGFGSHRWGGQTLGLAEMLYHNGYSVVTVSSAYNYEFMNRAASTPLPGYIPVDAADMLQALTQIDQHLQNEYGERLGPKALMGYSMGGFHALYLAATEQNRPEHALRFSRYVAIDPPVRLMYALQTLDANFRSALEWPAAERTENIEHIFLKVAALARNFDQLTPESTIPFSALESRFVIGLAFRLSLRDIIFLSQLRHDQDVLRHEVSFWRREPAYREILQYSFEEYLEQFLNPYYASRGVNLADPETLRLATNLRAYTESLKENDRVRVIANENDILINAADVEWMRGTFSNENLTTFERGGHVGNLHDPAVQRAILNALEGLDSLNN